MGEISESRPRSPTTRIQSLVPAPCPLDRQPSQQIGDEPPSERPVPTGATYSSFKSWQKKLLVLAASLAAFFSPVSAQIYFPALNDLAREFHVSSSKINLTITTYMVFQGVVPMFVGSFADSVGRRPAYAICFIVYIAANIGLALSDSYASLLVVRCLQSAGSSSTVALCTAVASDVVTSAERGQYVGYTIIPVVLGPSLGPVIGGLLVQYLSWRAIFWFLAIMAGVMVLLMGAFMPETCRNIVGDGSVVPHPVYWSLVQTIARAKKRRPTSSASSQSSPKREPLKIKLPNPFGSLILLFEKEVGLVLTYSAVVFAGFYAIATALPTQLNDMYGFDNLRVGLMYLPLAGGSIATAFIVGPLINRNYARHCKKCGIPVDKTRQQDLTDFPIERARLEVGVPLLLLAAVVMVAWGWAMQAKPPVAVPCVLMFILGIGLVGFNNSTNILLVDICPGRAATVTAANNLTRCLIGAGATAVIVPLINGIGTGWAFTLIGALYIVFMPALFIVMKSGIRWRKQAREKADAKKVGKKTSEPSRAGGLDETSETEGEKGIRSSR